jgi:ubiquitin carboxyl-terminal hydrolase L5
MDQAMPDFLAFGSEERRRSSRIQLASSTRSDSLDLSTRSTPTLSSSRSTPADKSTRSTQKEDIEDIDPEPTPSKRPGLRIRNTLVNSGVDPIEEAMKPLTDEERRNWKGWVDFDSDPVSQFELLILS